MSIKGLIILLLYIGVGFAYMIVRIRYIVKHRPDYGEWVIDSGFYNLIRVTMWWADCWMFLANLLADLARYIKESTLYEIKNHAVETQQNIVNNTECCADICSDFFADGNCEDCIFFQSPVSGAIDASYRNHGSCYWRRQNRKHKFVDKSYQKGRNGKVCE